MEYFAVLIDAIRGAYTWVPFGVMMPTTIDTCGKYLFTLFSNIIDDSFAVVNCESAIVVGLAITLLSPIVEEKQDDNATKVINNIVRYMFKDS